MGSEANTEDREVAALAGALADGIEAALPGWVERSVSGIVTAWSGQAPSSVVIAMSRTEGLRAAADVGTRVRTLLAADVELQSTNPMSIVRTAVSYPTQILRRLGVAPVVRDAEAARQFPDDDYDLTPTNFADLDHDLGEAGLAWGAAKAFVVLRRRSVERGR